eukprot:8007320-Karenia_brevis.AAC.1
MVDLGTTCKSDFSGLCSTIICRRCFDVAGETRGVGSSNKMASSQRSNSTAVERVTVMEIQNSGTQSYTSPSGNSQNHICLAAGCWPWCNATSP